jgi:hypothetical protein
MSSATNNYKCVCQIISPYPPDEGLNDMLRQFEHDHSGWISVIDTANDYLVSPALWGGLKANGLLNRIHRTTRDYLKELFALNANRNIHLKRQLLEAIKILNAAGITPLLLKGAGQLLNPIHVFTGSRLMSDLDILIDHKNLSMALDAFTVNGYNEADVTYDFKKLHHWAPLLKSGHYGAVELHREALNKRVAHILPTADIVKSAVTKRTEWIRYKLPNPTHSVVISLLHSNEFSNVSDLRQYNLRTLHDLTALNLRYPDEIDWPYIKTVLSYHGLKRFFESYMVAAKKLFGMPYPQGITPDPYSIFHNNICMGSLRWPLVERATRMVSGLSGFMIKQKKPGSPVSVNRVYRSFSAASYSPTQLPVQYHRR